MDHDFVLLRSRWGNDPDCLNVGVEVVSLLRICLAGNLRYRPPWVGRTVPELLVEESFEMITEFSSFLLWFLLLFVFFL